MITQDGDSDFNSQNHSQATPSRGRASETVVILDGTATVARQFNMGS